MVNCLGGLPRNSVARLTWLRPKWPKMYRRAVKQKSNQIQNSFWCNSNSCYRKPVPYGPRQANLVLIAYASSEGIRQAWIHTTVWKIIPKLSSTSISFSLIVFGCTCIYLGVRVWWELLGGSSQFLEEKEMQKYNWATSWKNQQNDCVPKEDSDQPGHLPSLIRVFAICMMKPLVLCYP